MALDKDFRFDDVVVDPQGFQVFKAGAAVDLEPKALNVLVFLIENRGRLIDKRELIDAVWGETFVTENVLSRAIAQLRKALADDAKDARYIETVPTRGYRFIAVVAVKGSGDPNTVSGGVAHPSTAYRRRSPWLLPVVVGVLALLILAVLAVFRLERFFAKGSSLRIADNIQITSSSGLSLYPTFSPDGTKIAYSTDRGGGFEIFVRQLAAGGQDIQITKDGGQNMQPTWSPDGRFIAYYSYFRGGIWVVPALGGTKRKISDVGSRPSWSRDGEWIAFQSSGKGDFGPDSTDVGLFSVIRIMKADGSAIHDITRPGTPEGGHGVPSWSPDGRHIAFVATTYGSSEVWCAPTVGGTPIRLAEKFSSYFDPVFSHDGSSVLFGKSPSSLWRVGVDPRTCAPTGAPEPITASGGGRLKHLALSQDGKKLAYTSQHQTGSLLSLPLSRAGEPAGQPVALNSTADCRSTAAAFSPDGSRIAFVYCRGAAVAGQIYVMNADGSELQQLTTESQGAVIPSWFPDGRHVLNLVPQPAKLESIDVETRRQTLVAELHQDAGKFQLSPNGKQIALSSMVNGVINLWLMDVSTKRLKQLTFDKQGLGYPVWSPNGKMLAAERQDGDDQYLVVVNVTTGAVQDVLTDHAKNWVNAWSPDGDKLYYAKREESGVWNIWAISRSTGAQTRLTHYNSLNSYVRYPACSPHGNQIVYEYSATTGNIWMLEFK